MVNLDPTAGHGQKDMRPTLVLSTSAFNALAVVRLDLTTAVSLLAPLHLVGRLWIRLWPNSASGNLAKLATRITRRNFGDIRAHFQRRAKWC